MWSLLVAASVAMLVVVALLHRRAGKLKSDKQQVCVILGSGGHTTEMCELLRGFRFGDCARVALIAGHTDGLSHAFFLNYFQQLQQSPKPTLSLLKTRRTNEVRQSKLTSVATTLLAAAHALYLIVSQLLGSTHLIANGPGLCVPYFYLFWVFNKLGVTRTRLIFVESWCRVQTLSTTGQLVGRVADEYLVHWRELEGRGHGARYIGQLI